MPQPQRRFGGSRSFLAQHLVRLAVASEVEVVAADQAALDHDDVLGVALESRVVVMLVALAPDLAVVEGHAEGAVRRDGIIRDADGHRQDFGADRLKVHLLSRWTMRGVAEGIERTEERATLL